MKAIEPDMMRLMLRGALCLAGGTLILLLVSGGWLGNMLGLPVKLALLAAIGLNALGALYFGRYSYKYLRHWLGKHRD